MANFKKVNSAINHEFPNLAVEVVRGVGYVYFVGDLEIDSIMTHPTSTSSEDLIRLCLDSIKSEMPSRVQQDR
jgi:hypothetical protein